MTTSNRYTAEYLRGISRRLFAASGAPDDIAATVAEILVNANLAGHDSHGVQFVPMYLDRIEDGHIVSDAHPEIVRESANTMHVDGHSGFGPQYEPPGDEVGDRKGKAVGCLLRYVPEYDAYRSCLANMPSRLHGPAASR